MMRVLICGGRELTEDGRWFNLLGEMDRHYGPFTAVIHGGQRGGDNIGREWADLHKLPSVEYRANWRRFGKRAGPLRNQQMIDEGKPDMVIALPGGRGTADMINRAHDAGLRVIDAVRSRCLLEMSDG
jgi:YspA, cpYpsA-related SLOG family